MKKKKLLIGTILASAVLGLSACGGDQTPPDVPPIVEAEECSVTFETSGGSKVDGTKVKNGEKVNQPSDPTREGYTFGGWYRKPSCLETDKWDFTKNNVTADITLYAKWTANKYTVTFKIDGEVYKTQSVEYDKAPKEEKPEREGHTFNGWYTDELCSADKKFDFKSGKVKGETTLYGKWEANGPVVGDKYTVTYVINGHGTQPEGLTDVTSLPASLPVLSEEGWSFGGWYTDNNTFQHQVEGGQTITENTTLYAKWTENGPVVTTPTATLVYNNGQENGTLEAVEEDGLWFYNKPADPTRKYYSFAGWFKDSGCTTSVNFDDEAVDGITLYAKWEQAYDTVNTVWNFAESAATIVANPSGNVSITADSTFGKFFVGAGARFEIGARNCINTQNKKFEFTLGGAETNNGFTFTAKWGSSSAGNFVIRNKATQEVVYESGNLAGGSAEFNASVTGLVAGTYEIVGTGSVRFYDFALTEKLPQGPTTGIELELSGVQTDFLLGREFNSTGLSVYLAYENGRKDLLPSEKFSVQCEDFTTAGKKTVTITHLVDATTTYTKTYTVNVCEISEVVLYDYVIEAGSGSVKYVTKPLQTVFNLNDTFNTTNLTVKAKCLLPETTDKYIEFILDSSEYTISPVDLTTAGNKSVTVSFKNDTTKTADYSIEVVAAPDLSAESMVMVNVNPDNAISATGDAYNFHTINQALKFLELTKAPDNAVKMLVLAEGKTYFEKVEINLPNVVITNTWALEQEFNYETATEETYAAYRAHTSTIEFNALNGLLDPSGVSVHSTDGSASVCVRPDAEGFSAMGITFKNYWNTNALYNESLTLTSNTQAVALLNQADKSAFVGCTFTSYHDTLEAQIGRQYYLGCFIEGRTDYIFGYNATAYFEKSEIHTLGAGVDQNNGGYVVATKGNTKTGVDAIEYGYIFNNCTFTADDQTMNGSTSIARGWDVDMRVMVMNSELGAHISTEAYGEITPEGKNLNDRYGKMNAAPVASQLLEYNNTGAGAIQASLADTCTVVDEATAAPYASLKTIFAASNGQVEYAASWAGPFATKDATITLKNVDDTDNMVLQNFAYQGSTITESEIREFVNVPAGQTFAGFFSDAACTTAFDFDTVLTENTTIYVKFMDSAVLPSFSVISDDLADGDITTDMAWGTNGIITLKGTSGAKFTVDANSKTITDVNGNAVTTTKRLKCNGVGRVIEIDLSQFGGQAVIEVFALTSSSSDLTRGFKVLNAAGTQIGENYICDDAKNPKKFTITLDCGQVYRLEGIVNGINYYGINIKPAA